MNQNEINRQLWEICENFKNKTNIKKDYIEYISALIYIRYFDYREFKIIYEERESYYVTRTIDKVIEQLQIKASDRYLFSNIQFRNMVFYRDLGEKNVLSKTIDDLEMLTIQIIDKEQISEAYDFIVREATIKDEISKEKGEFYTPTAITNMMTKMLIDKDNTDVYDPLCGSGNFLVSAAKQFNVNVYGQERSLDYYNICKTKMLLNEIECEKIEFKSENPNIIERELKYDYIFANPPFSQKNWSEGIQDKRIFREYGLAETAVGDYAHVLRMLEKLKENGKIAVILPHGVLFRETEKQVRRKLVEKNNIESIIGLPENLFYQTRMSVVILILSKNRKKSDILFIDASNDFINDKKNNILLHKNIVDVFKNPRDIEDYSHIASVKEIEQNNYDLTIKKYIVKKKPEENIEKQKILKKLRDLESEEEILEQNMKDVLKVLGVSGIKKVSTVKESSIEKTEKIKKEKYDIDYKKIGANIRKARIEKKYTQDQLAEKLDFFTTYICRIENGMAGIRLETLAKICNVLDVNIQDLL